MTQRQSSGASRNSEGPRRGSPSISEQTIRLLEMMDERQNLRLTVIEKKLDISTGTNPLAGAPEQESVSEQNKRLIEALLQPTPQALLPGNGLLAPLVSRKA